MYPASRSVSAGIGSSLRPPDISGYGSWMALIGYLIVFHFGTPKCEKILVLLNFWLLFVIMLFLLLSFIHDNNSARKDILIFIC